MGFDPEGFDNAIFDQSAPTEFANITKLGATLRIKNILAPVNATVNAYNLTVSPEHSEGGREIEIVLRSKPVSNTIKIPLEKTNLTFYFQPPLTEEFLEADCDIWTETHIKTKDGRECWRPENVVGSYAVYHSTLRDNDAKNGKIMHIYRAQLIDALGAKAWADFNRDANTTSQLIITLPQAFLDSAVYPVVVDPTFGYESIGASTDTNGANRVWGLQATSPSDAGGAVIDKITMYVQYSAGAGNIRGLMVAVDKTILTNGVSDGVALPAAWAWVDLPYTTKPTIAASTTYHLCGIGSVNYSYKYDSGGSALFDSTNSYASPTNPTDGTVYSGYRTSIYATYTVAGAEGQPYISRVQNIPGMMTYGGIR